MDDDDDDEGGGGEGGSGVGGVGEENEIKNTYCRISSRNSIRSQNGDE